MILIIMDRYQLEQHECSYQHHRRQRYRRSSSSQCVSVAACYSVYLSLWRHLLLLLGQWNLLQSCRDGHFNLLRLGFSRGDVFFLVRVLQAVLGKVCHLEKRQD